MAAIAPSWLYLSASENLQLVNSYLKETGNSVSWIQYLSVTFRHALWLIVLLIMVRILFKQDTSIDGKEYFKETGISSENVEKSSFWLS